MATLSVSWRLFFQPEIQERVKVAASSFEEARNLALKAMGEVDSGTRQASMGGVGAQRGAVTGFTTEAGNVFKQLRLDWDTSKSETIDVMTVGQKTASHFSRDPGRSEEASEGEHPEMSTRGSNQVSGSLRRIPRVISALRAQVSPYRVIEAQSSEAEAIADWIELHFPVIGMQIDWSKVSSSRCIEWSETADLVRAFATIIRDLPSQTTVVVTWSDALYPSLEMPLSSVARVAPEIFESCFDTWIICQAENWCIEAHHEGTLCFGHGRPSFVFLGIKQS